MGKKCTKLCQEGLIKMLESEKEIEVSESEKEIEVRSVRFILSAVLRQLGELSDLLPYDPESLPMILRKIEQKTVMQ